MFAGDDDDPAGAGAATVEEIKLRGGTHSAKGLHCCSAAG